MPNGPSVVATRLAGVVGGDVSLVGGGVGVGVGGTTGGGVVVLSSAFLGATGSLNDTVSKPAANATSATEHSRPTAQFFVLRRGFTCAISFARVPTPDWNSFYANVIFQHLDLADFSHTAKQEYYVQRKFSPAPESADFCSSR